MAIGGEVAEHAKKEGEKPWDDNEVAGLEDHVLQVSHPPDISRQTVGGELEGEDGRRGAQVKPGTRIQIALYQVEHQHAHGDALQDIHIESHPKVACNHGRETQSQQKDHGIGDRDPGHRVFAGLEVSRDSGHGEEQDGSKAAEERQGFGRQIDLELSVRQDHENAGDSLEKVERVVAHDVVSRGQCFICSKTGGYIVHGFCSKTNI